MNKEELKNFFENYWLKKIVQTNEVNCLELLSEKNFNESISLNINKLRSGVKYVGKNF